MTELCEWRPGDDEPSKEVWRDGKWVVVPGNCPNVATEVVGTRDCWHLCASCAALPRFRRMKRVTRGAR